MVWDEARWDKPLRDYHRRLIQLRRGSPALQRGGFQLLLIEPDTIAYQRETADDRVLVFAHRANTARVPDGACFMDIAGGRELQVRGGELRLPELPLGALILRQLPA